MRILTLTNLYPNPVQPGRAPFNRQQVRSLAVRHEVSVIAPISWTEEWAVTRRSGTRVPPSRRVQMDGIEVEHPRYYYPPKVLRRWYGHCYRYSVQAAFSRVVQDFRPDVIYAPWAYPDGWAAVQLGHRAGLPVVLKVHGSDINELSQYPSRRRPTARALREADAVVAVSEDLAAKVVALGADSRRVQVVYDGVDTTRFHPGPWQSARERLGLALEENVLLFVGRVVPVKAIDILIEACALLKESGLCFACILAGDGPLRARLSAQVAERGLVGQVRFLGEVAHDRLPDWYRAANVVALPSYSEGVPGVLLEALACGVPFVASKVGGVPEIAHLGECRLVPSGEPTDLALALKDYLTGEPQRSPGERATLRGWEDAAGELEALFDFVIANPCGTQPHPVSASPGESHR